MNRIKKKKIVYNLKRILMEISREIKKKSKTKAKAKDHAKLMINVNADNVNHVFLNLSAIIEKTIMKYYENLRDI